MSDEHIPRNIASTSTSPPGARGLVDWAGGDRVTLAIVFTDIVGSTALGVRLGDERMDEVRLAHFRRSEALIAKYHGRQVKTIGDSVMAVFRAIGAAFDYAHSLHLDPGADELRAGGVRAGIHSGEVRVEETDVFGSEVNFAARVSHAIEGAEIWLSGGACEAVNRAGARHRQHLQWQQHDDVAFKGFPGKHTLWSLIPNPAARSGEPVPAFDPADRPERPVDRPPAAVNGRTIFVARPAADMRQAHARVVDELKSRGFTVVPEADIPGESGAIEFVDAALAVAELSIHLLGDKPGFTPDGVGSSPIVRLQLGRAARRARAVDADKDPGRPEGFQRIIWAPKILEDPAARQPDNAVERDPLAVLERFGELLPTDKVPGDNLTQFINFLYQHLDRRKSRVALSAPQLASGDKIYIDHAVDDLDYADELAGALQERSFTPILPTLDGKPNLVTAQNRKKMQGCKAVALCWGSTSEQWVMAHADNLDKWRRVGLPDQFVATLLAAPPRGRYKERALRIRPPGIDRVIDMTGIDKPSPGDLDKWLGSQPDAAVGGDD